jgi:hypothetical protein
MPSEDIAGRCAIRSAMRASRRNGGAVLRLAWDRGWAKLADGAPRCLVARNSVRRSASQAIKLADESQQMAFTTFLPSCGQVRVTACGSLNMPTHDGKRRRRLCRFTDFRRGKERPNQIQEIIMLPPDDVWIFAHGNVARRERRPGDSNESVVGEVFGWGQRFTITVVDNIFHFPIPYPILFQDSTRTFRAKLTDVAVQGNFADSSVVNFVDVWDAHMRIFTTGAEVNPSGNRVPHINLRGDYTERFDRSSSTVNVGNANVISVPARPDIVRGINVSVGVGTEVNGGVAIFTGVAVRLTYVQSSA